MEKKERIMLSLRDSILWVCLTSFIGLIQIVLYYMVGEFVDDKKFDLSSWFKNGAIIAFSLALVSSIFFDTHFQKSHMQRINASTLRHVENYFGGLFYKLLPWLIVLMVTFTTMLDIFIDQAGLNQGYLQNTQVAGVIIAYMYTLYFKYCSFYVGLKNDI